jgi:hypothetical protein
MEDSANIFNTVKAVINKAQAQKITTTQASNQMAEDRIQTVARLQRMRTRATIGG